MTAIAFDTLKFVHRLREAGFPEMQAEAVAEAFKDASGEAELATKRDIERLENKLSNTESKLIGEMAKFTGEMALLKWMLGFNLALAAAIVVKLLAH
jgi:hypothetical protein